MKHTTFVPKLTDKRLSRQLWPILSLTAQRLKQLIVQSAWPRATAYFPEN